MRTFTNKFITIFGFISCLLIAQICLGQTSRPTVTVLCELEQRPGNPAVGIDGTVYFSMHPFDQPEYKINRLVDGKPVPYPNREISRSFAAVIGIQASKDGTLWWLDMGNDKTSPKLIGWDTKSDKLKAVHVIPREASVANSFHQDFAIDEKRNRVFIADMSRAGMIDNSEPAIVVLDFSTGQTRRVLSGNRFFQPDDNPISAEGKPMRMKDGEGKIHEIKLGLNPIAIDPENKWVFFGAMTPGKLYRVPAASLGDFSKTDSEIESQIEEYAAKPSCDGIAAGRNGNVFITNVDDGAITIASANGTSTWIKDERLVWPDGLYIAPDQSLVVTVNQLNRAASFNGGQSKASPPYQILRINK